MISFERVLVMGAGAVGGYFGGRIAERTAVEVSLIARGRHLTAIQNEGLKIKSVNGDSVVHVKAYDDPAKANQPDLILFTVKSYDTPAAVKKIMPVVGDETQILTIQNGIENYPALVEAFGAERVVQGFCKIGAGITESGVIAHKALGEITVGEKDGSTSPRLKKIQLLCDESEIPLHITGNIEREVWLKFAWNGVFNMITAVANVTVEKLFADDKMEKLCYDVFREIKAVAGAEGVILTDEDGQNIIEPSLQLKGFETSTYQDRQKGKKLEYEAFTGAIVRLAQKHDIAVPHNETLYSFLKVIDKNL